MRYILFSTFLVSMSIAGCSTTYHVVESAPDYITRDSLRNSINVLAAMPIAHPGKILSSGNFLFINEPYKGWHIVDNTMPSSTHNIAFLTAPGSLDGACSSGVLYINNSVDMVVLNVANPSQPSVIRRIESILQTPASPHSPVGYYSNDAVIIGWHDTVVTETFQPFA